MQSVLADAVVLKALDGSSVRVPVGPKTRIFVDGKRALLGNVDAGLSAIAGCMGGNPTPEL